MKRYHSLLEKIEGHWCIAFGDYSRKVVNQERIDQIDDGMTKRKNLKIIETNDDQASIEAAVAKLNQGEGK